MTLLELNDRVKAHLEQGFPDPCWVQAELSSVMAHASGHCYIELVQKAERGNAIVAKARGIIWRSHFGPLRRYFEQVTGRTLSPGIKLMVEASVTFSPIYGFSLVITDIDPAYTLGDLALRRREILNRLQEEGVLNLNKELPFPELPQHVAVISSPTAAGYGDFCRQLEDNVRGFYFRVELFPALMQGERVEQSVIAALDAIAQRADDFDVVVIIRGGGATSDLTDFDSYALAAACAQFPLPIVTGIGHERDNTVIDEVVHTRVKTPTAAAALLIDCLSKAAARLVDVAQRLKDAAEQWLRDERRQLNTLVRHIPAAATRRIADEKLSLLRLQDALRRSTTDRLTDEDKRLARLHDRLVDGSKRSIDLGRLTLHTARSRLQLLTVHRLQREHSRLQLVSQRIADNAPERVLARGYSLTMLGGRVVKSVAQLTTGDLITTRLQGGEVESTVGEVRSEK